MPTRSPTRFAHLSRAASSNIYNRRDPIGEIVEWKGEIQARRHRVRAAVSSYTNRR